MAESTSDIHVKITELGEGFAWAVLADKPVRVLFQSPTGKRWDTRAEALAHFQDVSTIIGWDNETLEVRN